MQEFLAGVETELNRSQELFSLSMAFGKPHNMTEEVYREQMDAKADSLSAQWETLRSLKQQYGI